MHDFHDGLDFRLHDDYGISLPSVGQRLMFLFSWLSPLWLNWVISLALTVSELRTISLFPGSMYIYWIVSP